MAVIYNLTSKINFSCNESQHFAKTELLHDICLKKICISINTGGDPVAQW